MTLNKLLGERYVRILRSGINETKTVIYKKNFVHKLDCIVKKYNTFHSTTIMYPNNVEFISSATKNIKI